MDRKNEVQNDKFEKLAPYFKLFQSLGGRGIAVIEERTHKLKLKLEIRRLESEMEYMRKSVLNSASTLRKLWEKEDRVKNEFAGKSPKERERLLKELVSIRNDIQTNNNMFDIAFATYYELKYNKERLQEKLV